MFLLYADLATRLADLSEESGSMFLLYADLATRFGDLSVESGCLQGHCAPLQSALQLSGGGEQMDPAWWPHPCALNPVQCAKPVLCVEPNHLAVILTSRIT